MRLFLCFAKNFKRRIIYILKYILRMLYSGYLAVSSILCYSKIIIKRKEVKIMYPVQLMIYYFTTSFTAIMHIGREVTAKQYTGGGVFAR